MAASISGLKFDIMQVQMRARQIAIICAMWLLIAHCVAAQTRVPSNTQPPNAEEIQLHTYLDMLRNRCTKATMTPQRKICGAR